MKKIKRNVKKKQNAQIVERDFENGKKSGGKLSTFWEVKSEKI